VRSLDWVSMELQTECASLILDRGGLSIGYISNLHGRTEVIERVHVLSAPYLSQPLCVCCGWVNRRAMVH
jgi:hypothetical protein